MRVARRAQPGCLVRCRTASIVLLVAFELPSVCRPPSSTLFPDNPQPDSRSPPASIMQRRRRLTSRLKHGDGNPNFPPTQALAMVPGLGAAKPAAAPRSAPSRSFRRTSVAFCSHQIALPIDPANGGHDGSALPHSSMQSHQLTVARRPPSLLPTNSSDSF